jgi:hypothetical protein
MVVVRRRRAKRFAELVSLTGDRGRRIETNSPREKQITPGKNSDRAAVAGRY